MNKPLASTIHASATPFRAAMAGAMALAAGSAAAADVPWQFTGDDTRPAASVATAAAPVKTFVSWMVESDSDVSGDIRFCTQPPAFVLIVR